MYRANRYRLGVSLFRNNIRDLIDSRLAGTPRSGAELAAILAAYGIPSFFDPLIGRQTFVYLNVSRIVTQGIEVDGEWSAFRNFRVGGAYTYLNVKDRVTNLGLTQRHPHQGYVRADYANRRLGLTANLRGTFFSDWLLNAQTGTKGHQYALWDAYVSKNVGRGFQMYTAVDNLNNSRDRKLELAAPTFDRPDYGRTWRAGLHFQFHRGESFR
ncbi:MAG: TonB-dependent receptor [Phycisphaerales bacterium]|nr:TonB-dependent receptor [Phycisphaerales bacterium]